MYVVECDPGIICSLGFDARLVLSTCTGFPRDSRVAPGVGRDRKARENLNPALPKTYRRDLATCGPENLLILHDGAAAGGPVDSESQDLDGRMDGRKDRPDDQTRRAETS